MADEELNSGEQSSLQDIGTSSEEGFQQEIVGKNLENRYNDWSGLNMVEISAACWIIEYAVMEKPSYCREPS